MPKKSIAKNYLFNASYQMLALIVPLITTPYISRVLQASGIGIYSYTYSIVSYFTLIAVLGTATYGNRLFGILQDKPEERSKRFWDIFLLRFITSGSALLIYLVYVFFTKENQLIALIQSIYILGVMFDISWFFQGMEEFKKIAVRNYIIKIINVIYIFVAVRSYDDLWKYVFGLAFLTLVGNLSIWFYLPKFIIKLKHYKAHPFKDIKDIIQLFIPSAAIQIYAMLDKSMIGWFSHADVENGYYEQSEKIVKMCLMLVTALSTVMIPRISKAFAENRREDLLKGIYDSYQFVWFLSIPLMCGLIGVTPVLVPVFFGSGFDKVEYLLPIFSLLFIFMGLNSTTGSQYLITTGQQNQYTKFVLIGGIVNIIFNIILIPLLYSIGAGIASVVGEAVIMTLEMCYIYKNKEFSIRKVVLMSKNFLIAGLTMLLLLLLFRQLLSVSVISLVILIILGIVIYFSALFLLKEPFLSKGLNMVKSKFKKS